MFSTHEIIVVLLKIHIHSPFYSNVTHTHTVYMTMPVHTSLSEENYTLPLYRILLAVLAGLLWINQKNLMHWNGNRVWYYPFFLCLCLCVMRIEFPKIHRWMCWMFLMIEHLLISVSSNISSEWYPAMFYMFYVPFFSVWTPFFFQRSIKKAHKLFNT